MRNILVFSLLFITTTLNAVACDCRVLSAEEKFCHAESVLLVKIRSTWAEPSVQKPVNRPVESDFSDENNILSEGGMLLGHYDILSTYKGNQIKQGFVATSPSPSSCGISIAEGKLYVLYLNRSGASFVCDGSIEVTDSQILDEAHSLALLQRKYSLNPSHLCSTHRH